MLVLLLLLFLKVLGEKLVYLSSFSHLPAAISLGDLPLVHPFSRFDTHGGWHIHIYTYIHREVHIHTVSSTYTYKYKMSLDFIHINMKHIQLV